MKHMVIAGAALVALASAAGGALAADKVVVEKDKVKVSRSDNAKWCGDTVGLTVDAPAEDLFAGDRLTVQKLLGGARAAIGFECPTAKAFTIVGRVGKAQIFEGHMAKANGWVLNAVSEPAVSTGMQMPMAAADKATPVPGPVPAATGPATTAVNEGKAATTAAAPDAPASKAPAPTAQPTATPLGNAKTKAVGAINYPDVEQPDFDQLLSLYMTQFPETKQDDDFAHDWAKYYKCAAFLPIRENEFRVNAFYEKARKDILDVPAASPRLMKVGSNVQFGKYDFGKGEFVFEPFQEGSTFTVGKASNDVSNGRWDCRPETKKFPISFSLRIKNPEVSNGLPMDPGKAETFLASRLDKKNGYRDSSIDVVAVLQFKGFGKPQEGRTSDLSEGLIVPVDVEIVQMQVIDRGYWNGKERNPEIIYALDDARKAAKMAEKSSTKAVQGVGRGAPRDLGKDSLAEQYRRLAAGEVLINEAPWKLPVQFDVKIGQDAKWFLDGFSDTTRWGDNEAGVTFVNADEFAVFTPDQELAAVEIRDPKYGRHSDLVEIVYVPIGSEEGRYSRGKTIKGYILSMTLGMRAKAYDSKSVLVKQVFAAGTEPKTWDELKDKRTAKDFDVLGVKGGMTLVQVKNIAEKALGQTLESSNGSKTLSSPSQECQFSTSAYGSQKVEPRIGMRCLVATFDGASNDALLTNLSLTQIVSKTQATNVRKALNEKYGKPSFGGYEHRPAFGEDAETGFVSQRIVGWGKRYSDDRADGRNVAMPQFALEGMDEVYKDKLIVRLFMIDEALAGKAEAERAKAAAEKKAKDEVQVKF